MHSVFSKVLPSSGNVVKLISLGESASQLAMYAYNHLPYQINYLFVSKPYFLPNSERVLVNYFSDTTEILVFLTDNDVTTFEPIIMQIKKLQKQLSFAVAHFALNQGTTSSFAVTYLQGSEKEKSETLLRCLALFLSESNSNLYLKINIINVKKMLTNTSRFFMVEKGSVGQTALLALAHALREELPEDYTKIILQLLHGVTEPSISFVNALQEVFSPPTKEGSLLLSMGESYELTDNQFVIRLLCA